MPIVYGHTYRRRPISEVLEEIKTLVKITGLKNIYFVDDNLTGHRDYAKELFRGLLPLEVRWSCLWTINTSRDEELLDLAKKTGCYHVNIGIENVCAESIAAIAKVQNPVQEYGDLLKKLQERNLFYSLNFMFGLDGDTNHYLMKRWIFWNRSKLPWLFLTRPRPGGAPHSGSS